jgi:hypothetical protein
MSPREPSTPEELSASREARVAARRKDRHERYLHFLRWALRTRRDSGYPVDKLSDVIKQGEDELETLVESLGGRIVPRRRPKATGSEETCTVFIDECGAHSLRAKEEFEAFCLAAVIIRDEDFGKVDRKWKRWKRQYLGSANKRVHEPDIRHGRNSFWCDNDRAKRGKAVRALARILDRLDFSVIACVVNRPAYVKEIGAKALDESLPQHPYLMTMHFLLERAAMALHTQFNGARARLVIESRGPLEDARMQYEIARLFLDGTSYVSATWFRQQFFPGVAFRDKNQNCTGLQLADLIARPCGQKVLYPQSTPARWPAIRKKLCPGMETGHSIVGLKIVPWEDRYQGIWKS